MKVIEIREFKKDQYVNELGEEKVKVTVPVASVVDGVVDIEEEIHYEFDKEYDQYFCYDRCDGIVVQLLWQIMRTKHEKIVCSYPISEKLWYNLTYHVIPQMTSFSRGQSGRTAIEAPLTKEQYHPKIAGMGMSRGVDSFATFYEYCDFPIEEYRVNQLTYYNVGAHHGEGVGDRTMKERYLGQLEDTKAFCDEYNYPLLAVDSDLHEFMKKMFNFIRFDRTHTFRNLGCTLMFQKLFSKYYYSSAYNLDGFAASVNIDCAHYEKWLIPLLSTENTSLYSSNQDWSRIEKTKLIADKEGCRKYLLVCFSEDKNCGKCEKCRRTLMQIDALGGDLLDGFDKSFDLKEYYENDRDRWFNSIDTYMDNERLGLLYRDTFFEALINRPELVENSNHLKKHDTPVKYKVISAFLNARLSPTLTGEILQRLPNGFEFECSVEFEDWCKVVLEDGRVGWCSKKYLEEK